MFFYKYSSMYSRDTKTQKKYFGFIDTFSTSPDGYYPIHILIKLKFTISTGNVTDSQENNGTII